eukprot:1172115-Rhodomonas_salina.5
MQDSDHTLPGVPEAARACASLIRGTAGWTRVLGGASHLTCDRSWPLDTTGTLHPRPWTLDPSP